MVVGEIPAARVLQVENADGFILVDQRHRHLGASFGVEFDVARVFADIGNHHRGLMLHGVADQPASDRHNILDLHILPETHRETMLELGFGGIEQQDTEHLVVNDAREQLGDTL